MDQIQNGYYGSKTCSVFVAMVTSAVVILLLWYCNVR